MAISVFPAPSAGSSVAGKAYSLTFQTVYKTTDSFPAGIYVVTTSPTSYQAKAEFVLSNNTVVTATTVSGTVTVNLTAAATEVYFTLLDAGGNGTILTITQTAGAINTSNFSGTLDTITSSGTYNQTGKLYVVAVGGGGNGGGSTNNSNAGAGGGGGSGDLVGALVYTNTATTVTIGGAGGTTSFGNLVSAAGGGNGRLGGDQGGGGGNSGGAYGGTGGIGGRNNNSTIGTNGNASAMPYVTIKSGTTGGGGGGGAGNSGGNTGGSTPAGNGGGSGIGTGGNGGVDANGNAGTGYGSGGGGGGARSNVLYNGGAGAPGVIYVLRGF